MSPRRLIAAIAAVLSALILQATLLTPLVAPLSVSLPAVLVAVVAIEARASVGLALGFSAGLLADLASDHPAGILALCWMGLGVGCGVLADPARRRLPAVLLVAALSGATSLVAEIAVRVCAAPRFSFGTELRSVPLDVLRDAVPTVCGQCLLALLLLAPVRAALRADGLREPRTSSPRAARTGTASVVSRP